MAAAVESSTAAPVSGTCRYCGCTDARGCFEICWWVDAAHTACSARACLAQYFADHKRVFQRLVETMRDENSRTGTGVQLG